jgi:ketosteroid isomerase-like protein
MQESTEVREAVLRFYERITAGDVDGAAATIADDPGAFVVGTERTGSGREAWLGSLTAYAEMQLRFEAGPLRAWANGDLGWAYDEPTVSVPDGPGLVTRHTAVLERRADGAFRFLHQHYSFAIPDDVAIEQADGWRERLSGQA